LQKVSRETGDNFHGVFAVMVKGADCTPLEVAVIEMSPFCPLKWVPVLAIMIWAPVVEDKLILASDWDTDQDVDEPPLEVRVTEVG
jgi:hypothetical protein